jgi:hypothetical protein
MQVARELVPVLGIGLPIASHAEEGEPLVQEAAASKVVQSRYQLSHGEVAGGTEDHDGARFGRRCRGLRPFVTPGRDARFSSGSKFHRRGSRPSP